MPHSSYKLDHASPLTPAPLPRAGEGDVSIYAALQPSEYAFANQRSRNRESAL